MKKKVIVLSLGGSLIIPNEVDIKYLKEFKKTILKNTKKYKFIIVCGGGSIARKYIHILRDINTPRKTQDLIGMQSTRLNNQLVASLFNDEPSKITSREEEDIKTKKILKKQDFVFVEAGEYHPKKTSDAASAQLAVKFKTILINLTNVPGLYNKNPKKYKNAKFISKISWEDFHQMANKSKFKPGQHFVLDQTASKMIMKNKIPTYIIGNDLKQLDNFLNNKEFKGTTISNFN